ncbi:MAG: ABC transporter substrate-binding protein [Dehalococcoidales bacterium]|nr:ABC transporter substrate-binding protein [Dehalococcoidales bacterium]
MKRTFKKLGVICLVAFLFSSLLASCTTTSEDLPMTPVLIIDQLGRTVTLETTNPQRIVSLAPSHTETLYALGLGDRLVAVTDYCNYPPEAEEKPSIGGFSTPNIEEVVAMDPDLILATNIHEAEVIPQLEAKGFTVVAVNPTTIDEVIESITLIGKVTGAEEAAASLVADMQSHIKAVTDKTGTLTEAEKSHALYIVWHDPLMAAGAGTLQDEFIRTAGGINVADDLDRYATISLEVVIASNPQVMIAGSGHGSGGELTFEYIQTEERLKDTDARQNGRIYSVNSDLAGRPTPRIVEALEQFAGFIHPELFK